MIYMAAGNTKTLLTTPSHHFLKPLTRTMRERSRWFIYRYGCVTCATCFPYITVSRRRFPSVDSYKRAVTGYAITAL
uniref:Uncharacterized protein n=1 Tax=Daphnia magna TaxID=35525 RepID=A0A0P6DUS2_9CRUS